MYKLLKKSNEVFRSTLKVSKLINTKRKKARIALSLFLLNTATFFDIISILTFASFFEDVTTKNPLLYFFIDKTSLLPIYVFIRFSFIYFDKLNMQKLQLDIEMNLKEKLMNEIFYKGNYSSSDSFFYVGQLTSHIAYFYKAITSFLNVSIQATIYFVYLVIDNSNLIVIFFAGFIVLFPITKYLAQKARQFTDFVYHENKKIYADIQKIIDNLFIIKIFKLSNKELQSFKFKITNYRDYNFKSFKFTTLNYIIPNFLTLFLLSILVTLLNFAKLLTLEFIGIIIRFFQSLGELNRNFTMVMNSEIHLDKFFTLHKNFSKDFNENYVINKSSENKSLSLSSVFFKYIGSTDYIFEDISIEINHPEKVLITGENGSGKSTLLGLIAGVYFPEKGKVEHSYESIGYVGTESSILEDTLRNNLNYGLKNPIDDNTLLSWIDKFRLFSDEKIINLDMKINEKTLSTGQKQKISFIRALLSNVDLLLLDEAMSNLDTNSKKDIISILNDLNISIVNSTHFKEDLKYDKKVQVNIYEGKSTLKIY